MQPYPYFDLTLDLHLVASIEVEWTISYYDYSEHCVIREPIKKAIEKFKLPLDFAEGISKGDLSRFGQRGRDNRGYFTWYIPTFKQEVRLHGLFLDCLRKAFQGKPLGPCLLYYKLATPREVIMVEQNLLLEGPHQDLLEGSWNEENVLSALENLGISKKQGKEKISYLKTISPQPSSDEEAITIVLKSL